MDDVKQTLFILACHLLRIYYALYQ